MICTIQNPGYRSSAVVRSINEQLERLLGKEEFGLVERSNHIALLPHEGTVRLVPYYNYDELNEALKKHRNPSAATVWKTIAKWVERDADSVAEMITKDLWAWFDREGGRETVSLRHYGKKGVY